MKPAGCMVRCNACERASAVPDASTLRADAPMPSSNRGGTRSVAWGPGRSGESMSSRASWPLLQLGVPRTRTAAPLLARGGSKFRPMAGRRTCGPGRFRTVAPTFSCSDSKSGLPRMRNADADRAADLVWRAPGPMRRVRDVGRWMPDRAARGAGPRSMKRRRAVSAFGDDSRSGLIPVRVRLGPRLRHGQQQRATGGCPHHHDALQPDEGAASRWPSSREEQTPQRRLRPPPDGCEAVRAVRR
ncbi:hypothetical protein SAMN05443572_114156 [Myxococcus fulvus]|uniref:Uncharacterized protein n=1 Tax=Myxococcus fulvus TaxID=33 RepID=A0ABY1CW77_MYXFU|nr:hypothetical protein SAMN05443572_114156 [Myxococcus fulvus]